MFKYVCSCVWLSFTNPPLTNLTRFDSLIREDKNLWSDIFLKESSLERERAVWELADKHREKAMKFLKQVAKEDSDPSIRWTTLWAIQKFGGESGIEIIHDFLDDEHLEVRSWANKLLFETGRVDLEKLTRPLAFDNKNPFDQTLPLCITGYARTLIPNVGWVQVTLSPKWFESILGRVMACTSQKTFDNRLIIEKKIEDFYPDSSNYYEIYNFTGHTQEVDENIKYHNYLGKSNHTFYPSGKVGDLNKDYAPPFGDMIVNTVRGAATFSEPWMGDSQRRIVRSVRGIYFGNAYVNIERLTKQNMCIGKGEVQLTDVFHPEGAKYTNTYLFGTFKGKLSSLNNDEYLNINTEPCHGTLDGKLDYLNIGSPSSDPNDPFSIA